MFYDGGRRRRKVNDIYNLHYILWFENNSKLISAKKQKTPKLRKRERQFGAGFVLCGFRSIRTFYFTIF